MPKWKGTEGYLVPLNNRARQAELILVHLGDGALAGVAVLRDALRQHNVLHLLGREHFRKEVHFEGLVGGVSVSLS